MQLEKWANVSLLRCPETESDNEAVREGVGGMISMALRRNGEKSPITGSSRGFQVNLCPAVAHNRLTEKESNKDRRMMPKQHKYYCQKSVLATSATISGPKISITL